MSDSDDECGGGAYLALSLGDGETVAIRKSSVQYFRRKGNKMVILILGKVFQVEFSSEKEAKGALLALARGCDMFDAVQVCRVGVEKAAKCVDESDVLQ